MMDSAEINTFMVYHFSAVKAGQGVLYKDPTVWLNGARPSLKYICKGIKIKIAKFSDKIIY